MIESCNPLRVAQITCKRGMCSPSLFKAGRIVPLFHPVVSPLNQVLSLFPSQHQAPRDRQRISIHCGWLLSAVPSSACRPAAAVVFMLRIADDGFSVLPLQPALRETLCSAAVLSHALTQSSTRLEKSTLENSWQESEACGES